MRRWGLTVGAGALAILVLFCWWVLSRPERGTTGSVSTRFHLLGPNDKIVVDGFDDPQVEGVACHISRAQTGGIKGGLGVAEDTSDASIACRQFGPIKITGELRDGEHRRALAIDRFVAAARGAGRGFCGGGLFPCDRGFGERDASYGPMSIGTEPVNRPEPSAVPQGVNAPEPDATAPIESARPQAPAAKKK